LRYIIIKEKVRSWWTWENS